MTLPSTIKGTQLYIKVGDGASPEVFTHPCLINSERGVTFRSATNDIIVPDCATPDDPAFRQLVKDALSAGVTGAGVLDTTSIATYDTWWRGDTAKNVQVWLGTVGYWEMPMKLTEWEVTGERNNKAQVSLTLESDGVVVAFAAS